MHLGDLTVYADGRFARYDDAKIGLLTHGLQYGTGCFEGVRGFWNARDGKPIISTILLLVVGLLSMEWLIRKLLRLA